MANWFVIFNDSEARVLEAAQKNGALRFAWKLTNPLARERTRALSVARPGTERMSIKGVVVSHSLAKRRSPQDDAKAAFILTVAERLTREHALGNFETLTVVCEPRAAGQLKEALSPALKRDTQWVHRNYGKLSDKEVSERLAELRGRAG